MNSILQEDKTVCFLCGKSGNLDPLDCHHVFGAANRKKSEKYGLKVYLHHHQCHIFGKDSVHANNEVNQALKAQAQEMAMEYYGWTIDDFRNAFGKNYL